MRLFLRPSAFDDPGVGEGTAGLGGGAGLGDHLAHIGHGGAGAAVHGHGVEAVVAQEDLGALGEGSAHAVRGLAAVDDEEEGGLVRGLTDDGAGLDAHAGGPFQGVLAVEDHNGGELHGVLERGEVHVIPHPQVIVVIVAADLIVAADGGVEDLALRQDQAHGDVALAHALGIYEAPGVDAQHRAVPGAELRDISAVARPVVDGQHDSGGIPDDSQLSLIAEAACLALHRHDEDTVGHIDGPDGVAGSGLDAQVLDVLDLQVVAVQVLRHGGGVDLPKEGDERVQTHVGLICGSRIRGHRWPRRGSGR